MSLIATFPQGKAEYRLVERVNYLRVKSTWEQPHPKDGKTGRSRPTWNEFEKGKPLNAKAEGLPDVWRIHPESSKGKVDRTPLTEDLQHWFLKINLEMLTGQEFTKEEYFEWFENAETDVMVAWLTSALTSYRSHTNDFGMNNSANYLTGERLDFELPKYAQLVTGWYIAQPVFENGQIVRRNIAGEGVCYGFKCINAKEDYWRYSPLREWWLFDMPLITGRVIKQDKSGTYIVRDNVHIPYPQFNELLVFPVMLPQDSTAFISVDNVSLEYEGKLAKDWIR